MTNICYVLARLNADHCDCNKKEIHKIGRNKEELSQYWMDRNRPVCSLLTFPSSWKEYIVAKYCMNELISLFLSLGRIIE